MSNVVEFVSSFTYDDAPPEVLRVLRRSFADIIGVAAVGATTVSSSIARETAAQYWLCAAEAGPSAMMFDGRPVSPAGAAMAGAFTIDSIDAHDGTTPCKGHAGSAIYPSLLALCDSLHRRGRPVAAKDFAAALAVAYEVSYRCGLMLHATAADYHASGAWTAVGVAAGASRLLGITTDATRHAMGIAEYHGPRAPMMRCIDHATMVRDGVGWGAPSGLTGALMAANGFTGAPALMTEGEEALPFWQDLRGTWRLVEDTHYKRYPVCRWAHPALDAARELMAVHGLTSRDVEAVTIETFHYATRLGRPRPDSLDEMTYSIVFPVAVMIARGRLGVAELSADVLQDPEILRIADATTMVDSEHYTRISVDKRWADVTLRLADGRVLKSEPKSAKGDRDDPLSDEELDEKYASLTEGILADPRRRMLKELALNFDALGSSDFETLLRLVAAPLDRSARA